MSQTIKAEADNLRRNISIIALLTDRRIYVYRQIVKMSRDTLSVRSNRTVSKALDWGSKRGILESPARGVYVMTKEGVKHLSQERKKLKDMMDCCEREVRLKPLPDRERDSETFVYGRMSAAVAFHGTEPSLREVFGGERLARLDEANRRYIDEINRIAPNGVSWMRLRISGERPPTEVSGSLETNGTAHGRRGRKKGDEKP